VPSAAEIAKAFEGGWAGIAALFIAILSFCMPYIWSHLKERRDDAKAQLRDERDEDRLEVERLRKDIEDFRAEYRTMIAQKDAVIAAKDAEIKHVNEQRHADFRASQEVVNKLSEQIAAMFRSIEGVVAVQGVVKDEIMKLVVRSL
jgi:H+/gluconate symporter-like permease